MSNGALLQLLLVGEEDKYLHSQDFMASKPFRQVFKKVTPFAVVSLDLGVQMESRQTYGQSLRFMIPRKGDLLQGITVKMLCKKSSEVGWLPAEELIESASLVMGKQVIDELSGEYIRVHNAIHDSYDQRDARYRMSDFEITETQGSDKLLYCKIPFFFSHKGCALPLIALQYMQPEVVIRFKTSVTSLDPAVQPQISITGDYVFLDDTEREWWTNQDHQLLYTQVHTVEDRVDIEQTRLSKIYTNVPVQFGVGATITGPASSFPGDVITIGTPSYITLVDAAQYPGESTILYSAGTSTASFTMTASLLIPTDSNNGGKNGLVWARQTGNLGYAIDWVLNDNDININVYRDGSRIVYLRTDEVFTSALTAVEGDTASYAIPGYIEGSTEVWISVTMSHALETISLITVNYDIEVYTVGGKLTGETALTTTSKFFKVTEGYSPVGTIGVPTFMGFNASSTVFDAVITDIQMETRQVEIAPLDENLTAKKTKIYVRGPIRYIAWVTTPLDPESQWAQWSTGEKGTYSTRYDPLDSAQILINGKERTNMEPTSYYTVVHPLETIGRALPSGLHLYSFASDPTTFAPNGSMNFSRAGDVVLHQRYKKWSPTATNLSELLASESLPAARDYKRLRIYLVGFNVLSIAAGLATMQYV